MLRRSFLVAGVGAAVAAAAGPVSSENAATAAPPTLLVLVYANNAYPARPAGTAGGTVRYVGPTLPGTWLEGDEWIQLIPA